jgi:predicted nuclease of restriction endonuclease-like (RecB) superfamily
MDQIQQTAYQLFLAEIKEKIYQLQLQAMQSVNKALIHLYWEIGKSIVEKQEQYRWGNSVVENLSKDLQNEFPGTEGFSSQNLWRMRKFYKEYQEEEKLALLVREIGWSHNVVIFEKCKDVLEREFYLRMTRKYGWTKNVLVHQIEGGAYTRFLANQTNFDKSLAEKYRPQAKLAVKDSYIFDFIELTEEYKERELELALVNNVRSFLQEMGGDFTFIGNQYKIEVGSTLYYIDLLLYHRRLKSLVAIELKTTEFKPEYAGKMQFYLAVLDDKVKLPEESPSIGIIVCKTKERTVVEYALKTATKPMGVADYSLIHTLPKELKGLLPSPEEIIETLSRIELQ